MGRGFSSLFVGWIGLQSALQVGARVCGVEVVVGGKELVVGGGGGSGGVGVGEGVRVRRHRDIKISQCALNGDGYGVPLHPPPVRPSLPRMRGR